MICTISVIIPARNSGQFLRLNLEALKRSVHAPFEVIVVDDASTENLAGIAQEYGALIRTTDRRRGPAHARNLGASIAKGAILLFLDSDVCVAPDTLLQLERQFALDPGLDGIIGSYDHFPASPDFLSQYRNLMHAYVHSKGARRASTFWSGCGAIRRSIFLQHSGFSETYRRPAIEDIELGYRLRRAGCRIDLDPTLQVTHLKRWTFWGLLKTDVLDRGIPWTELILRDRNMPNDLNLQLSQRVSVALVVLLVGMSGTVAIQSGFYLLVPPLILLLLMLAAWWSEVLVSHKPRITYPSFFGTFALVVAIAYYYRMYTLVFSLGLCPPILLLRHRYGQIPAKYRIVRFIGIAYICITMAAAVRYIWSPHHLAFACLVVFAITALLNTQFYVFLAANRGILFMLAAIPFHFLYHFYNGLSFAAGVAIHLTNRSQQVSPGVLHPLAMSKAVPNSSVATNDQAK